MSTAAERRRRSVESDPLNPQQQYTRDKHMAEHEQRDFETAVNTRASQQDRADTLKRTTGLPGAVPRSATRGSRMSEYDLKEQARRNALLPGMNPSKPGYRAPMPGEPSFVGPIKPGLAGPATPQNTGVTGVNAGTPDVGSTRRLPGQSLETFMPDAKGGRYVGSVANPPPRTDVPRRTKVIDTPMDVTPVAASTPVAGVRTVAIDPKYQVPGAPATGTSVEQWRHDLLAKHPEIFKAGTPENLAFVAAHKNPDGSMKPLDPSNAMAVADEVKAMHQKAEGVAIEAPDPKRTPVASPSAVTPPAVARSAEMTDRPGMPIRLPDEPAAPVDNRPIARKAVEGLAGIYGGGGDMAKDTLKSAASRGLDFLNTPATHMAEGLVGDATKIGRAVGPLFLSPDEQKSVGDTASAMGRALVSGAKGLDFAKNAVGAGLPNFGVQESEEEKRKRMGLP